jgi:hypothetical protein
LREDYAMTPELKLPGAAHQLAMLG